MSCITRWELELMSPKVLVTPHWLVAMEIVATAVRTIIFSWKDFIIIQFL